MICCKQYTVRKDAGAKRQRLLSKFLQTKSARRAGNSQEKTSSQDSDIEVQNHQLIMELPQDLLLEIFALLPAESLFTLQSKTMTFVGPENNPKYYFHFLDLDHGNHSYIELGNVITSYDGLVLATVKNQSSLMLMNPLTRKYTALPLGKATDFSYQSFGIAFCNDSSLYKVVHLYCEKQGDGSCEILSISATTRNWTRIEGPSSELLRNIRKTNPVSVGRSLYWMSEKHLSDYFVISINVENEKFITKKLPISSGKHSRIVEIGGGLGYVAYGEDHNLMQGWILRKDGTESEENWVKSFNINLNNVYAIVICSSRDGKEMVFEGPGDCLYEVYSRDYIDWWFERIEELYIPRRNTLVS
ncbi:hypothetical protein CDL12_18129 [Handroanthus impetiginosus]|uniref:F-box associated beta-propeller type 1 domain-containing protein n=1 Tax=Handroanthus impetiginosus TaxID=429701 RepID=A0A2G9GVJ7_9LAMI|nr:hypothetical protein CDL12_18129 [Handroanthus impetiginosus]